MESQRFDRLARMVTSARTRRGAMSVLGAAFFGAAAPMLADYEIDAKRRKKRRRKKKKKGGGGNNPPANQCPASSVCNTEPNVCGSTAGGDECSCELSVEGNNVCVNSGDDCPAVLRECTSTSGSEPTSCRNTVGFHFFCQENKMNGSGVKCG